MGNDATKCHCNGCKINLFFSAIKLQMEPQFKYINLLPMCASGLLEMVICKLQEVI